MSALTVLHTSDFQCGRPYLADAAHAMLRVAEEVAPDVVVASGDLTQRAKVREFRTARALLERFGDVPVVVTPGNHDVPLYRFWERLVMPYRNWSRFMGPELDTVTRVAGATFVALNSSAPRRAIVNGRIDAEQLAFARRAFASAPAGDLRIAVIHHHFVPVPDGDGGAPLPGAARVVDELEAMGVDVVLGGHVHRLHFAVAGDVRGRGADTSVRSGAQVGDRPGPESLEAGAMPILACGTTTSRRGRGPEVGRNSLCVLVFDGGEVRVTPYARGPGEEAFEASATVVWPLRATAGRSES